MKLLDSIKPSLTVKQLDRLSNIFDNAGQVVLGLVVISPLFSGIDKVNLFIIALGMVCVIVCWSASIYFAGKRK